MYKSTLISFYSVLKPFLFVSLFIGHHQRAFYSGKTRYHCLASLYVIDTNRRLIFFQAGFQGSWHDSCIFNIINLKDKPIPPYTYILGDRGFANKPPVITPYRRNELRHADITSFQRWIFTPVIRLRSHW